MLKCSFTITYLMKRQDGHLVSFSDNLVLSFDHLVKASFYILHLFFPFPSFQLPTEEMGLSQSTSVSSFVNESPK